MTLKFYLEQTQKLKTQLEHTHYNIILRTLSTINYPLLTNRKKIIQS